MKISATPLSVAREMKAAQLDQIKYFELLASAGAEATDIVDPDPYSWFWKDYKKESAQDAESKIYAANTKRDGSPRYYDINHVSRARCIVRRDIINISDILYHLGVVRHCE